MIEVEKKFQPTDKQLVSLLESAQFISEKENTDIYYDLPGFVYFKQYMRLRKRNSEYDLKIEIRNSKEYVADHHEEIEGEQKIIERLGFETNQSLENIIKEKMIIICALKTKRREYHKDEFIIDIDKTDFGYNMVEIELLVKNESEINNAEEKIIALAKQFDFEIKKFPGKFAECLRITNPEIYKELYPGK